VDSQKAGGLIMARRGGRRGGQGNRGRRSKANRSRNRSTKSSSRSKSTSSRRGGQGNKSRSTGRAKGTVSRKSVGKGLRSVAKAVGKVASKTKGFAGVGSITSAARAAASSISKSRSDSASKAARMKRRQDRLAKQHGLDYSRMKDSFKIGVNVDQAARHLGIHNNRLYKALPKSIRNFRFKHQMKAPTKLGVRDGYRAPNRGGSISSRTPGGIGSNMMRPAVEHPDNIARPLPWFGPQPGVPRPIRGLPGRPVRDTIEMMYENILGRKADQGGLDYWRNELKSGRQSRDDIRQNILGSDEFRGRSESDRQAALKGVEQRRSQRKIIRGRQPRFGPAVLPSIRGKGRARPTGKKPTGRGLFPSIAASLAARGF